MIILLNEFLEERIASFLRIFRLSDIVDIIIITYLVYKTLIFIRDTRTIQLLKGIVVLIGVMQISYFANLYVVNYVLSNAMKLGMIAILIVFQPELRRVLEHIGRTSLGNWFNSDIEKEIKQKVKLIAEIARSVETLSQNKIGALIVVERESKIGDIIGTGIILNSSISAELLVNVFMPRAPLHDGAVIIRENKIEAAACFLPLSQNPKLSKELGTRHRAGLGISEETDCIAIVVSEETGNISVAIEGNLTIGFTNEMFVKLLTKLLRPDEKIKTNIFRKNKIITA
ncbi:MAG: diadenylate cyclase CdaA [Clostridiales bacterium]|jgi:diadenylate cyclase|nr:diadenylate cyclase CdaA [Clostridiales bacterium]